MIFWVTRDDQDASPLPITSWKVIRGHLRLETVFTKPLHWKDVESWDGLYSHGLIKTHRLLCNMTYFSSHLTLTLVKFWPWPFDAIQYTFQSDLTRETRWHYCRFFSFIGSKVIREKHLSKTTIFDLQRLNRWPEVSFYKYHRKKSSKLSAAIPCILLGTIVSETTTHFLRNYNNIHCYIVLREKIKYFQTYVPIESYRFFFCTVTF